MAEITPPHSQQGTPQRGPQPIPAQAPPSPTEPSAGGPMRGATGMELDASSASGPASDTQIAGTASVPPPTGLSAGETEATAGASGARKVAAAAAATAKPKKEKKKNELFESDIVERWNTEIGDVLAPLTTADAAAELSEPTPA